MTARSETEPYGPSLSFEDDWMTFPELPDGATGWALYTGHGIPLGYVPRGSRHIVIAPVQRQPPGT